tara:strand:- start:6349 stop:8478 length:2130 start_codon:yes stop_codon:yes gene_type:complete
MVSEKYGVPFLYLTPEYLGEVSFISYTIIGFSIGGFIMAFNISSYITNGHRFPFIATLSRPFIKYSLNNIFWSGTIIIAYLISAFKFLIFEEGHSFSETIIFLIGFLTGICIMIGINFVYFNRTNKDVEILSGGKYKTASKEKLKANPIKAVLHKKVGWENFFNADREWKVETYLSYPFNIGIARSIDHYDRSMLKQVLEQNHLNAALFEIIVFISLIGLSFGSNIDLFNIPAGASITLIFTMFVMVTSAIHSWFRGWAPAIILALLLGFNFLSQYDFLTPPNKAYGLNYENEPAKFNQTTLNFHLNKENYNQDSLHTIKILEKWKIKNTIDDKKPKMVFINTTGGGMRSALWSFCAIQYCDSILNGKLLNQTQLISGSSGGLIGLAYLRELMLREQRNEISNFHESSYRNDMAKDILNRVAFYVSVNDMLLRLQTFDDNGFTYRKDRGYAFEKQLNENTRGYLNRRLNEYYLPEYNSEIPMLIINPTIVNNGKRLIISPQPISYLSYNRNQKNIKNDYLTESIEFKRFFKNQGADDLQFTSALRMSSTFPYVMPIVHLPSDPEFKVMDAGLRDNFGVKNSIKFLYTFKKWIEENTSGVVFIQIRDSQKKQKIDKEEKQTFIESISLPVRTVYKNIFLTQDYDHDQLLQYTNEWFKGNIEVINLVLNNSKEKQLSLSWHLTESEKKVTYNSIHITENRKAFNRIEELLK